MTLAPRRCIALSRRIPIGFEISDPSLLPKYSSPPSSSSSSNSSVDASTITASVAATATATTEGFGYCGNAGCHTSTCDSVRYREHRTDSECGECGGPWIPPVVNKSTISCHARREEYKRLHATAVNKPQTPKWGRDVVYSTEQIDLPLLSLESRSSSPPNNVVRNETDKTKILPETSVSLNHLASALLGRGRSRRLVLCQERDPIGLMLESTLRYLTLPSDRSEGSSEGCWGTLHSTIVEQAFRLYTSYSSCGNHAFQSRTTGALAILHQVCLASGFPVLINELFDEKRRCAFARSLANQSEIGLVTSSDPHVCPTATTTTTTTTTTTKPSLEVTEESPGMTSGDARKWLEELERETREKRKNQAVNSLRSVTNTQIDYVFRWMAINGRSAIDTGYLWKPDRVKRLCMAFVSRAVWRMFGTSLTSQEHYAWVRLCRQWLEQLDLRTDYMQCGGCVPESDTNNTEAIRYHMRHDTWSKPAMVALSFAVYGCPENGLRFPSASSISEALRLDCTAAKTLAVHSNLVHRFHWRYLGAFGVKQHLIKDAYREAKLVSGSHLRRLAVHLQGTFNRKSIEPVLSVERMASKHCPKIPDRGHVVRTDPASIAKKKSKSTKKNKKRKSPPQDDGDDADSGSSNVKKHKKHKKTK
jgi:hypothetical protein